MRPLLSVYCVEVEHPDGDVVVLNTKRGFLRAAVVTPDHTRRVKWLGGECLGDVAPRRHCMFYAEEQGYYEGE